MQRAVLKIAGYIILITFAIVCVIVVYKFNLAHDNLLNNNDNSIEVINSRENLSIIRDNIDIPQEYLKTDVAELISIRKKEDVSLLRKKLINLLWGNAGLPSSFPSTINENIRDERYDDLSSLRRIDKLRISMEFGLESQVYHFIPKNPNRKVVLYHEGHDGDFYLSKHHIKRLMDEGYSVFAFSMPLLGLNNQPTVQIPRQGKLKLTSHEQIKFLSPQNGHPIKYFIEPVVIILNYIENQLKYSFISMLGISGGGWTTTLSAAIDTRINYSFPVAGSYPIYLRSNSPKDWGDYEQTVSEIYNQVNYLELYILGASGIKRRQIQVINEYDICCFSGTKWKTYKDIVRNLVHKLGDGEFDVFMDSTHKEHIISPIVINKIIYLLTKLS
jgi:hypothetical protein